MRGSSLAQLAIALVTTSVLVGCQHAQVVEVTSNPIGAELWVDGKDVGPTPTTFTDNWGDGHYYQLKLQKAGFQPREVTLKQVQDNDTVATYGFLSICCPLARIQFLYANHLPKQQYEFTLDQEGVATPRFPALPASAPPPVPATLPPFEAPPVIAPPPPPPDPHFGAYN
jgi:hypothetical protein